MGVLQRFEPVHWIMLILGVIALISITATTIASTVHQWRVAQLDAEARIRMLERGFSPDEIVKVLGASSCGDESDENLYSEKGPATCDVVAFGTDGEWHHALILDGTTDNFLLHFIGEDIKSNAWVERNKVRFPASVAFDRDAAAEFPEMDRAQPATVESDGEWRPAYVVMHLEQCFVHYVGTDWSDNEWVDESRVRFSSSARFAAHKPAVPCLDEV
jgi:hypothetical protein